MDQNLLNELIGRFKADYSDNYSLGHAKRYALSYLALQRHLKPNMRVLEVGGPGAFRDFVLKNNPGITIDNTQTDLRYKQDIPDNTYDLLLNMEVIEHIKDQRDTVVDCFNFSGVQTFVSECYRVLKPQGIMFLTTPNAHTVVNLVRILELGMPIFYKPHVREYGINDLGSLLTKAGFNITKVWTDNSWDGLAEDKLSWIRDVAASCGSDVSLMNEDIFLLAKK